MHASAVADISSAYPKAFAGSSMNQGGAVGGRLEFVGAVAEDLEQYLVEVPVKVVAVGGASFSQHEVSRAVLTYQRRLPLSKGDIQYNRSSEDVGHSFYHHVGEYRDIDGPVGTPSVDQYLCFFGRNSGNHCDNVRDLTTCRGDYCNLVDMDEHDTGDGDSGGPWYYGSRPYGVHSGWHSALSQERAQWTPLHNTLDDLDVLVRVGSDG